MLHSLDECEVASLPKSKLVAGILLLVGTIWLIINCKLINTWREEKCNSRPWRRFTCFTIQNTRKRGRWTFQNAFYFIPYLSNCAARWLSLQHILALLSRTPSLCYLEKPDESRPYHRYGSTIRKPDSFNGSHRSQLVALHFCDRLWHVNTRLVAVLIAEKKRLKFDYRSQNPYSAVYF